MQGAHRSSHTQASCSPSRSSTAPDGWISHDNDRLFSSQESLEAESKQRQASCFARVNRTFASPRGYCGLDNRRDELLLRQHIPSTQTISVDEVARVLRISRAGLCNGDTMMGMGDHHHDGQPNGFECSQMAPTFAKPEGRATVTQPHKAKPLYIAIWRKHEHQGEPGQGCERKLLKARARGQKMGASRDASLFFTVCSISHASSYGELGQALLHITVAKLSIQSNYPCKEL